MLTLECCFPFQCSSDAHCCSISYTAENDPHRTERNLPLDSWANSNGMAVAWISFHKRHVRKSWYLTVVISHLHQPVLPPWFSNNLCLSSLYIWFCLKTMGISQHTIELSLFIELNNQFISWTSLFVLRLLTYLWKYAKDKAFLV